MKHKFLIFILFLAVGFLLGIYDYGFLRQKSLPEPIEKIASAPVLPQAKVNETFDQGQYFITWSNPRYETDLNLKPLIFMVDLELVNKSFPGKMQMIVNCDRDEVIGLGVSFNDDGVLVLPIEGGTKVTACRYTPSGSYDPNFAVEVRF